MENVQLRVADRISNLPDNVTQTILICLPIRDAVRTSILSRNWRHVWTRLPQFVLDDTLFEDVSEGLDDPPRTTFVRILYQLLLGHAGPINKFTLSYSDLDSCTEIDYLISFLSKRDIADFSLEMWTNSYSLPVSIFSCPTLRCLKLRLCSIRSFASTGFSRLTSLKLIYVTISAETLASLISRSPLLAKLEIDSHFDIDIHIDAPNLRTLAIKSQINSITFKRVPSLASVSIKLHRDQFVNVGGVERNVVKFFDCLVALKTLRLSYHVVKCIGVEIPKMLPTSLIHLEDLKLYNIRFREMAELSFTACLLRSSPNLKYIKILFEDYADSDSEVTTTYMEGDDFSNICLNELREVKLDNVAGTKKDLEFIRLLLAQSSSLKKMRIQPKKVVVDNGFKILKEVTKFRRISKDAEVIYVE